MLPKPLQGVVNKVLQIHTHPNGSPGGFQFLVDLLCLQSVLGIDGPGLLLPFPCCLPLGVKILSLRFEVVLKPWQKLLLTVYILAPQQQSFENGFQDFIRCCGNGNGDPK